MSTLLAELRRRNVLKVAAGYVVVAWVALQVLDVLAPILQLPTWLQRTILLLLAVGLLVTLALVMGLRPDATRAPAHAGDPVNDGFASAHRRRLDRGAAVHRPQCQP